MAVCSKCGFANSEQACGGSGAPLENEAAEILARQLYEGKGAVVQAARVLEELAGVHAS